MKKVILSLLLVLVVGAVAFVGYALLMKPKPKAKRSPVQVEAPAVNPAAPLPGVASDAAPIAPESPPPNPDPASVNDMGLTPPPGQTGTELGTSPSMGSTTEPGLDADPAAAPQTPAAPGPTLPAPAVPVPSTEATPQASAPSTSITPSPVGATAQETAAVDAPPREVSSAASRKPRAPRYAGVNSLMATWKASPRDQGRPVNALLPYAKTLAGASSTTLIAHTDFIQQRPGVYTAMVLWNGPKKPDFNLISQRAGLVTLDVADARLAGELPRAAISSFTSGVSGDHQRIVYGGYGALTVDIQESKKSAIVTLMDSGSPRFHGSRPMNSNYTAVVMGEVPPVRDDQEFGDKDCVPLTGPRLEQLARDGMPIDNCLNVIYHRTSWSLVAVSPSAAIIRRGGTTLTVAPGSIVPDLGKVTRLDPVGLQVLTERGSISVN